MRYANSEPSVSFSFPADPLPCFTVRSATRLWAMTPPPQLSAHFAEELPELTVAWQAEEAPEPELVVLNEELAVELGLDPDWLRTEEGIQFLVGRNLPADARPVAQGYAGHQFGQFVPRLGDGRALLLGEVTDQQGQLRDIHLKGAGATPFARGGDGRAVIGPMLREYLISEAIHALGIPTTRSLAVLTTGRKVVRGHVQPGALLVRVADSLLRVGSFQYARLLDEDDNPEILRRVADHAIRRHDPAAAEAEDPYLTLFENVLARQAGLVARWGRVGFIHGVMNTDNTTISGETIDYGPCAFMDAFDPDTVYSSIDAGGRYAYKNQPAVIGWNLTRFAEAMLPLIDDDPNKAAETLQPVMSSLSQRYRAAWLAEMSAATGLPETDVSEDQAKLLDDLLELLTTHSPDLTRFNRLLSETTAPAESPVLQMFADDEAIGQVTEWLERWWALGPDTAAMQLVNPVYIPRNHLVEEALGHAETGDYTMFHELLDLVTTPFRRRDGFSRYEYPAPDDFGSYITYCGT